MLSKLSELFDGKRAPTGYRAGVTLENLRRNLAQESFESLAPGRARFRFSSDGPVIEVVERTESQLLMHLVMTQFQFEVETVHQGAGCYEVHHTGTIRRTGLRCQRKSGSVALGKRLTQQLNEDPGLRGALMPLDFKKLTLQCADGHWKVVLEHMGGSEVVNRMPAFRRYITLAPEQRRLLLLAIVELQRVLSQQNGDLA